MMWMRWTGTALLGCLIGTTAWAQATASATLSNLRFQLMDLDVTDGVPVSYSLAPRLADLSTMVINRDAGGDAIIQNGGPVVREIVSSVGGTTVQVHADDLALSAWGTSSGTDFGYYYGLAAWGQPTSQGAFLDISLSPRSLLLVKADADVQSSVGPMSCQDATSVNGFARCRTQSAGGTVNMYLTYFYATGGVNDTSSTGADYVHGDQLTSGVISQASYGAPLYSDELGGEYFPLTSVDPAQSQRASKTLSSIFINSSHEVQHAQLRLYASVVGEGVLAQVPEPGTWATMSLGLVGLAALSRRRLQHQA